jgi:hypothetical protein
MIPGDRQTVGLRKRGHSLIVRGSRAELVGELFDTEEFPVVGTRWVVQAA